MIPSYRFVEHDDHPAAILDEDGNGRFMWIDGTVELTINSTDFSFHIDAKASALPAVIQTFVRAANRLGFEVLDDCEPELCDDGWIRVWLVPIEPVTDVKYEMPSLVETGYGPYSMEIPVVPAYIPPPAHTTTRVVRRGRHRAKP